MKGTFLFIVAIVATGFCAMDSTTVQNGVQTAAQISQVIAASTGHTELLAVIGSIAICISNIVAFIFGHKHGKDSVK